MDIDTNLVNSHTGLDITSCFQSAVIVKKGPKTQPTMTFLAFLGNNFMNTPDMTSIDACTRL